MAAVDDTSEKQSQDTTNSPEKADTSPEGGLSAWLTILGACCGIAAASGSRSSLGLFQAYLLEHQFKTTNPSIVGWIFSFFAFNSYFWGLFAGPVFDRYGPRWLLLLGSSMLCASFFLLGVCTEIWHFLLALGLLGGTGSSLMTTACYAVVSHWFSRNRAFASGVVGSGGSCGGVLFTLAMQQVLPQAGFAWSSRIVAFIMLFFCIVCNLLIRPLMSEKTESKDWKPSLAIFKDPPVALMAVGLWFLEWGYFIPSAYIPSFAIQQGFSDALSYQCLAIFSGSAFFGRLIPGLVADRLGRFNTLLTAIFVCILLSFLLWIFVHSSETLLILLSVLFGFWSACDTPLFPPCLGQLCDTGSYGRVFATTLAVSSFAPLTALPISGAILDTSHGDYLGVILFAGANYFMAFCFILAARVVAGASWRTPF